VTAPDDILVDTLDELEAREAGILDALDALNDTLAAIDDALDEVA
jgi:hypothetical protein